MVSKAMEMAALDLKTEARWVSKVLNKAILGAEAWPGDRSFL